MRLRDRSVWVWHAGAKVNWASCPGEAKAQGSLVSEPESLGSGISRCSSGREMHSDFSVKNGDEAVIL